MDQLGLLVVGEADVLLAQQLPGFVEAAGDADRDHAPRRPVGLGDRLPVLAETGLAELVVGLEAQPVVHGLDRVVEGQGNGGDPLDELHAPSHAVASEDGLLRLFEDDGRRPADPARARRHAAPLSIPVTEGREVEFLRGRPLFLPLLLEPDDRPEDFGEEGAAVGLEGQLVEVLLPVDGSSPADGEVRVVGPFELTHGDCSVSGCPRWGGAP